MERIFIEIAGDDMEVDWMELKRILDHTMRDGKINFCFYVNFINIFIVFSLRRLYINSYINYKNY